MRAGPEERARAGCAFGGDGVHGAEMERAECGELELNESDMARYRTGNGRWGEGREERGEGI